MLARCTSLDPNSISSLKISPTLFALAPLTTVEARAHEVEIFEEIELLLMPMFRLTPFSCEKGKSQMSLKPPTTRPNYREIA
jgi:hypothetical protein